MVDGRAPYKQLHVVVPSVEIPAEVEVKLERAQNKFQERVMRLTTVGELTAELTAFPRVRPEIGRFCVALQGKPSAPAHAKFTVGRVFLR